MAEKFNHLTAEEEAVIVQKKTEAPFSGKYDDFYENGIYVCRRCNAPLYRSEDKFDARCGWPSFDEEIPKSVERKLDADSIRTEIACAFCGAHLGHIFIGENLTPKNARHCVNSISMKLVRKKELETAVFGGGCFWCVEAAFNMVRGVVSVVSGYAGGPLTSSGQAPTYEEVSNGQTGHAEVVKIEFYPKSVSYENLLSAFFYIHNPTTLNRQGNDIGSQYRSIILYTNENQKLTAEKFIKELEESKAYADPIVTQIEAFDKFYPAEDYHQCYFKKNPTAGYCQIVIAPKIKKLTDKFKELLK